MIHISEIGSGFLKTVNMIRKNMILKTTLLLTIVLTFFLINLGGIVHNTGSSLACPDWPLCYGQVMPPMEGGILIEHSHRLLGSLVGLLTVLIVVLSRKQPDPRIKKVSVMALLMVIVQGLLGGLTVIFKLPTLVSTAHLGLSMLFISTLVYLHHATNNYSKRNNSVPFLMKFSLAIVYFQMLLGAFIRHSGLGGVCGVGSENSVRCLEQGTAALTWLPQSMEGALHMSHRFTGVLIALILALNAFSTLLLKVKESNKLSVILAAASLILVLLQIQMGMWTIAGGIRPLTTTLHLTVGTLLLLSLWNQYLYSSNR